MLITPEPLVDVSGLTISYRQGLGWHRVVEDVSFKVERGEVFGLVGESGCGKSTVALQFLGYRHAALRTDRGRINFDGQDVLKLGRSELDHLRGAKVSFVPQNPTTALNPGIRVGAQIQEVLTAHGRSDVAERTQALFGLVGLPEDVDFKRRYPHQLSGGQQQRVCIAMALACDPQFVVLDEPTTGLDVTTQEQIVELLIDLRARLSMSMLYVTHDLGLLSQLADRIGVMYAGRIVEVAPTAALFADPRHPYTRGLISAIPRIVGSSGVSARPLRGLLQRQALPKGCPFAPRCDYALPKCFDEVQVLLSCGPHREAAGWRLNDITPLAADGEPKQAAVRREPQELLEVKNVTVVYGHGKRSFTALRDITLRVGKGETVALVGESGSGKSTLARAIAGLAAPAAGTVRLGGVVLAGAVKRRTAEQRRLIQYVFQNPDASLNPRATVATSLARPFVFFYPGRAAQAPVRVAAALSDVRLDARYAERYPDQLSGGERQRIAIARALMAEPELLLCDEILSALDVSVQANILALLLRLKRERAIAMLFISHDLAVVRMLADHIYVLFRGEVMERGTRDQVFTAPFHPYTHALLEAVPAPMKARRPAARRRSEAPAGGSGCPYAGRCAWQIGSICESDAPPWRQTAKGLAIRCHHSLEELNRRTVWPHGATNENNERKNV